VTVIVIATIIVALSTAATLLLKVLKSIQIVASPLFLIAEYIKGFGYFLKSFVSTPQMSFTFVGMKL